MMSDKKDHVKCGSCDNFVTKIKYGYEDLHFCDEVCKYNYLKLRARSIMTEEQRNFFNDLNIYTRKIMHLSLRFAR